MVVLVRDVKIRQQKGCAEARIKVPTRRIYFYQTMQADNPTCITVVWVILHSVIQQTGGFCKSPYN